MADKTDRFLQPNMESRDEKKIDEPDENASFIGKTDKKDPTHENKNGCCGWVINILWVITFLQLIVLLVVTAIYIHAIKLAPREHEICLNCSELTDKSNDPVALGEFIKKDGKCCGTTSQILNQLVDKYTKEKYAKDLSNNVFALADKDCKTGDTFPEKAATKLAGISFVEMKQDASPLNIVHWNKTDPHWFIKSGLTYEAGRITILNTGFYYVFNQLQWVVNKTDLDPLAHQINRQIYEQDEHEVLLEGQKSKCNMAEESGEVTSSIGAVFELNMNDKIFVTASQLEHLVPCHHGNYFGLYLVA